MNDSDGSGAYEHSKEDALEHSAEESEATGEVVAREGGCGRGTGRVCIGRQSGSEVDGRSGSDGRGRGSRRIGLSATPWMTRLVLGRYMSAVCTTLYGASISNSIQYTLLLEYPILH